MELKFSGKQDVYIEVAERYKEYIRLGVIKKGEKLPSVRIAAGELGINPNTVAKAYSLLEKEGYICALPKKGAYVIYDEKERGKQDYSKEIELLNKIRSGGIDKATILMLIEEVYNND